MRIRLYLSVLAEPPMPALILVSLFAWLALLLGGHNMHGSEHHHIVFDDIFPMLVQSAWPWFLMILAMMSPLHANAIQHLWARSLSRRRIRAIIVFAIAYLAVWMLAGAVLILGAKLLEVQSREAGTAPLIGLLIAFIWQASPWKQICLNHCHWVTRLSLSGLAADLDCLRFGLVKGCWCVGSCWALMFVSLVSGSVGLPLMLVVSLYLFIEQYLPARPPRWGNPLLKKMLDEDNQRPIYRVSRNRVTLARPCD